MMFCFCAFLADIKWRHEARDHQTSPLICSPHPEALFRHFLGEERKEDKAMKEREDASGPSHWSQRTRVRADTASQMNDGVAQ